MEPKYRIKDIVTVINPGQTYNTYGKLFKLLEFKDTSFNDGFPSSSRAVIKNIAKHEYSGNTLYHIVTINGNYKECLIGEPGLKLYKSNVNYKKLEII